MKAPDLRSALSLIEAQYGNGYKVLSTRDLRGRGFRGLLGGGEVEVYFAPREVMEEWRARSSSKKSQPQIHMREANAARSQEAHAAEQANLQHPAQNPAGAAYAETNPSLLHNSHQESEARGHLPQGMQGDPTQAIPADIVSALGGNRSGKRLSGTSLSKSAQVLQGLEKARRKNLAPVIPPHSSSPKNSPFEVFEQDSTSRPSLEFLRQVQELLQQNSYSTRALDHILGAIAEKQLPGMSGDPAEGRALARLQILEQIRPKIPPCLPITLDSDSTRKRPKVVALVGPTGVGKTTTIAKLASPLKFLHNRKIGVVTLDTYRIGAVDQIERYCNLIGLPLEVVEHGRELTSALDKLTDCELVFVDTTGRSQNDIEHLHELREMLHGAADLEIHLCVSGASSGDNLLEIAQNYRTVGYDRILITKVDESRRGGQLYDLFDANLTPVSYVTCGQEVPDDIQAASVERLQALLVGD